MESLDAKKNKNNSSIEDEVQKLFKKKNGKISNLDFIKLKQKFNDDEEFVSKVQTAYLDKYNMIRKKAKKFANLIKEKYGNSSYPFHILLDKAKLFKEKHHLTDEEFFEFQRCYEEILTGSKTSEVFVPNTNLMKVLGNINIADIHTTSLKVNNEDYKYLQEILKIYSATKVLHSQISVQALTYNDLDPLSLTGYLNRDLGHNAIDHIHPVIVALFSPKIEILETHFLYSNIAGIIKARYNNEPLSSKADYQLLYDLINDPNDIICDNQSIMLDLLNRVRVQNSLWNCVLNLRNGYFYGPSFRDFIYSVDICKLNKYDNPDLIYGRYDGTIIKRLLSVFSFRPTIVTTTPILNTFSTNPYQYNIKPVVTSVHMINIRVTPSLTNNDAIELSDALEQHQLFRENNVIVPKHTNIIYSRGVLFFFVDRRSNIIKFNDYRLLNLPKLPIAISGFERINTRPVNYKDIIPLRNDIYKLRSVVVAELSKTTDESSLVIGSSTILINPTDIANNISRTEYYIYNPMDVNVPKKNRLDNEYSFISTPIREFTKEIDCEKHIFDLASQQGIIFMYQLEENNKQVTEILY
jgi:hypothetical protein